VLEAAIVFLVEGEEDADALLEHGFIATTNPSGAKEQWQPQYTDALRGREVIVWPDDDPPGWNRALRIGKALFGQAAAVRFLRDMGAKDARAWFNAGHSECELIAQIEEECYGSR